MSGSEEPVCRLSLFTGDLRSASGIWLTATSIDDTCYSLRFFLGSEGQNKKNTKKGESYKQTNKIHALFVELASFLTQKKKVVGGGSV